MSQPVCERCQESLETTTYEGAEVLHCAKCDSYWLGPKALLTVLKSTDVKFSREQRHAALEAKPDDRDRDPLVFCVECGESAKKQDVLGLLLVDICPGHGIWLDGGELDRIQILAETNEQWRKALVKLVSGKREEEL